MSNNNDEPERIAILGAGPLGLEAALYARFLGYEVDLYERGRVAENVRAWGHIRMFTPFGMNRSTLALAALRAQDEAYEPPDDAALLTGQQWVEQYLLPLSQTDLVADHLQEQTTVVAVGRQGAGKRDLPGSPQRADWPFRILLRDEQDQERSALADRVIDTSGVFGNAQWIGPGGMPAVGERALGQHIRYGMPDVLGADRDRYAGRHTLLVGSSYWAALTLLALMQLAEQAPGTRITWITAQPLVPEAVGPVSVTAGQRLPERARVAEAANRYATQPGQTLTFWSETRVETITWHARDAQFVVDLDGPHPGSYHFDQVVGNVGYKPDHRLYEELQADVCYATGGVRKLAAAVLQQRGTDLPDQNACGAESLLHPEPDFYILGDKSYGRLDDFLFSNALEQIRQVFSVIAEREDLDLYARIKNLLP